MASSKASSARSLSTAAISAMLLRRPLSTTKAPSRATAAKQSRSPTFADTITNKGAIIGSVATGGGDDIVNIYSGSSISGVIDGGRGTDTINLLGTGAGTLSDVANSRSSTSRAVTGPSLTTAFSAGTTIAAGAEPSDRQRRCDRHADGRRRQQRHSAFDHAGTSTCGI